MADSDDYKKFSKKLKGWKISPSDKEKLKKFQKQKESGDLSKLNSLFV